MYLNSETDTVLLNNVRNVGEVVTVFTHTSFILAYFWHPNFSSIFRGFFHHISRPSTLLLGMVTHSYCRSWQSVTSFALQECGISAVLVRTLGVYYNAETFHFKFMNVISNSRPNLKVTAKTMPSINSSHNFRRLVFDENIDQKSAKITEVNTVFAELDV
jgi:hypothetical protein